MSQYTYKYPRPAVTADAVIFAVSKTKVSVLLVERGNEPYKGMWALPGGFLEMDETLEECAARELREETGVVADGLSQIGAFSAVDRDPRGRNICVAFWDLMPYDKCKPIAGDDAAQVKLFPINNLPPLAFDHIEIIKKTVVCAVEEYYENKSFCFLDKDIERDALRNMAVALDKFVVDYKIEY